MILLADSGSSKTDWALLAENKLLDFVSSAGINPFFQSEQDILQIAETTFDPLNIAEKVTSIFFYGTGCVKDLNTDVVSNGLKQFFQKAEIVVEDDMLGAARAMFGNQKGIGCILGTGANSCKYDGQNIVEKIPTLGYILGDEASGAYFGKILINNYFKKIMPDNLSDKFQIQFQPELGDVLSRVYKQPLANRYLAKFTHFLSENIYHEYIQEILLEGFREFLSRNVSKYNDYQSYPVGFVGSIAYHFSDLLKKAGQSFNININQIIDKPINGLVVYHTKIV